MVRTPVLCGLGAWVPPTLVTNNDLAKRLDTTRPWQNAALKLLLDVLGVENPCPSRIFTTSTITSAVSVTSLHDRNHRIPKWTKTNASTLT
jgi:hypothetical protein